MTPEEMRTAMLEAAGKIAAEEARVNRAIRADGVSFLPPADLSRETVTMLSAVLEAEATLTLLDRQAAWEAEQRERAKEKPPYVAEMKEMYGSLRALVERVESLKRDHPRKETDR
ncbi:MAG: hypothetical protein LC745_07410 [Planctomycetia bacterium]|nr:hypothetical protein [Planctomycetia bacterium]